MRDPRSTRSRLLLAAAITIALGAVVAYVVATTDDTAGVQVGSAARDAFGSDGVLDVSIRRALFSPDGERLAVVTGKGVGIARQGQARQLSAPESIAVDAAWMPTSAALLIADGPEVIGQLAVISLAGAVTGRVTLDAPFSVGTGHGLSVDRRGARALAVAETRDTIGGRRHHDVVLVDLVSGHVAKVTETPNADETWPLFVDDNRIVFSRAQDDGPARVVEHDLTSGAERPLSPSGEATRVVGVLRDGLPVFAGGLADKSVSVWVRLTDGRRIELGRVGAGEVVFSVDPTGTRAVATRGAILRAVTLKPPPAG